MPVTLQPATLKYKNTLGTFQSADCLKGDQGVSPTVAITKQNDITTIAITDINGTVSTNITSAEYAPVSKPANEENIDLDIADTNGNVLMRIQDGYIKTSKLDFTDPYELPEYYKEHILAKKYRITELLHNTGGDAFIFCTDQHMIGNSHNSYKLIHYIHKNCRINKLFMGGDLVNGDYGDYANEFKDAIGGRCHFLIGNHEYMNNGIDENFAYSLTSDYDDEVSGNQIRHYYWVDNPKHKIRYIVTNCFIKDSTSYTNGFEQDQVTWLTTEAMNVPTGWGCIIFSHMFWNSASESSAGLILPEWIEDVLDAIDAANTNNQVLCLVQGHTHQDAIKSTTGGIPILITTADRHSYTDTQPYMDCREPGTWREQAFDVCIVDRPNNKLYAVRVGGFNTGNATEEAQLEAAGERVITFAGGI